MSTAKSITKRADFDDILADQEAVFVKMFTECDGEEFKYAGVNYVLMMAHLVKSEPNPKQMVEDMSYIIMATQYRGTNLQKLQTKSGETLVRKLKLLIAKYSIKQHKKDLPMTEPSLPRLVSLFPEQVYTFRKTKHVEVVGELGDLPAVLAWPGGLAMVKKDDAGLIASYQKWYQSFCGVVKVAYVEANPLIAQVNSPVPESRRHTSLKKPTVPPARVTPPAAKVTPPAPKAKVPLTATGEEALSAMQSQLALTEESLQSAINTYRDQLISAGWTEEDADAKADELWAAQVNGVVPASLFA